MYVKDLSPRVRREIYLNDIIVLLIACRRYTKKHTIAALPIICNVFTVRYNEFQSMFYQQCNCMCAIEIR
jgi:hypothetical protein